MKDYLESMLEEETEEEDVLELSSPVLRKKRREELDAEHPFDYGKETGSGGDAENRRVSSVLRRMGETFSQGETENGRFALEGSGMDWPSFADSRSPAGAWLYGVWRRREESLRAVNQRGKDTISVTLPEKTAGESVLLSAESLDRLVERDARRYDSGFSLY